MDGMDARMDNQTNRKSEHRRRPMTAWYMTEEILKSVVKK